MAKFATLNSCQVYKLAGNIAKITKDESIRYEILEMDWADKGVIKKRFNNMLSNYPIALQTALSYFEENKKEKEGTGAGPKTNVKLLDELFRN